MREAIDTLLDANHGVGTRSELLTVVTRNQLDDEIGRGRLVRLAAKTYSRPWHADSIAVRELAAQKSVGPRSALSHLTALARCRLPVQPPPAAIYVTTSSPRHIVRDISPSSPDIVGIVVHRTRLHVPALMVGNARTVRPEWAIVGSWPLLRGSAGRAPAIVAIRKRLTTVDRVRAVAELNCRLRDRAELLALLDLIESGCQSELELWGYTKVFNVPELRGAIRQRTIVVAGEVFRLDLAYERERLAVELDGREYHAGATYWERDIARDLALATVGWQTLRLSHRRLTNDVAGCRRDVAAVLAARRRS